MPSAPEVHALASNYLCVSLPHSSTYALIDLSDASLTEVLPVSQIDASDLSFVPKPNIAVIPGEGEFLVTSYTGVSTMGVFLNGQGDPVRGTIEWPEHPSTLSEFMLHQIQNCLAEVTCSCRIRLHHRLVAKHRGVNSLPGRSGKAYSDCISRAPLAHNHSQLLAIWRFGPEHHPRRNAGLDKDGSDEWETRPECPITGSDCRRLGRVQS